MAKSANTTNQFFTGAETFEPQSRPHVEPAPVHATEQTPAKETKSRKVQILVRPSIWDDRLQRMSDDVKRSKNDLLNLALEAYLDSNGF